MNFIELMSANVVSDNKRKTATTLDEALSNLKEDCENIIKCEAGAKNWVKELKSGKYSCTPNINKHTIFKPTKKSQRVRFENDEVAIKALEALVNDIEARDKPTVSLVKAAWQASIAEINSRNEKRNSS